jgi:hypothetical protein
MKPQTMKRFDSSKVRCLGNLVPLSDKQKAANLREFKKEQRVDNGPNENHTTFVAPYKIKFGRRTKRGFNGCKLDPRIRAEVERRRALNADFHAALRSGK